MKTLDISQTIRAAHAGLPLPKDMARLMMDSRAAERRGYYTPGEDERLRETYARYLGIRVALWEVIQRCRNVTSQIQADPEMAPDADWRIFGLAFCAAEMIVRTGEYLIDLARDRDIVWKKLDEADLRYSIPRKSFTRLYRQLTSAFRMYGFYSARDIYDGNEAKISVAMSGGDLAPVLDILLTLNLPTASRGDHLRRYRRFVRHSLKRRQTSAIRNVIFSVFEMMGSDIADLKIPLAKPPHPVKRVTDDIRTDISKILHPGDILITRHDDAMSNLFLPGFWPHAALWLGAKDADILEAKKDGVLLRRIEDTLQVDAFIVLRPRLTEKQIADAMIRGRSHTGKLYDFIFDFSTSDRLVCTEVIYRTYHGIGPIDFQLGLQAGRHCLSAEDVLNQGLGNGWFDLVAVYGLNGNTICEGKAARETLKKSFAATF